ncbi:MAG: phosphoribosyl-ATP diphosphatase [Actinobacteria bacterium]|nr:phosphoribosyl-ATP diphosphatase [Actinomycetota bacterium]
MSISFLSYLEKVIEERKSAAPEKSYTARLLKGGTKKICAKLVEESSETVCAALIESDERLLEESADLLYHLMVLLASRGLTLEQVAEVLEKRHK